MSVMRLALLLSIAAVLTVGAGCRRSADPSSTADAYEPLAWLPPSPVVTDQTPLQELRNAIHAFQEAKSFTSNLYISSNSGKLTARIEVMKPDRFRGTLQDATRPSPVDVIGVGKTLYVRSSSGEWSAVLDNEGRSVTSLALTAQGADQTLIDEALPEGTEVIREEDPIRGCTALETTIRRGTDLESTMRVCVMDGKPIQIDVTSKKMTYSATYSNYNDLFIIERPSIKK